MKFGNGQWATKKDSILAYNDENANFKPLPFVTSRASTATRVNKLGLIETVGAGIPRVDYLGNTKGAYLLEPQSTNLVPYSEDLTTLTKTNTTITANQAISPDGTLNADEIIGTGFARSVYAIGSGDITVSCYVKSNDGSNKDFKMGAGSLGASGNSTFTATGEWQRFTHTFSTTAQSTDFGFFASGGTSLGLYLFGWQLEQSSYATSYIPTAGSAITRLADTAGQTVPDGVINSSEGVFYIEAEPISFTDVAPNYYKMISLSNGTADNRIHIGFTSDSKLTIGYKANTFSTSFTEKSLTKIKHKIALRWTSTTLSLYVDGVEFLSPISIISNLPVNSLAKLSGDWGISGSYPFYGGINQLQVFKTALTDAELVKLTTI